MIEDYDRYRMGVVGAMPWRSAMPSEDRMRAADSAPGWLYQLECEERDERERQREAQSKETP